MLPESEQIWAALEFRKPATLQLIEPLTRDQMLWQPDAWRNPIAWQLWHIAEVEDNAIRDRLLQQPKRYPFGHSVRDAAGAEDFPHKDALIEYLNQVRQLTRQRLEAMTQEDYERPIMDDDFGPLTGRGMWAAVVTSFSWHAGQIALTARLLNPED